MDKSLSKEATDWREGRRLRAFELKQQGWSQQRIAEALGVSKGAVSQWMKRARDGGGAEALKRRPAPGARPPLSEEQRMKLPELLERGAEAHGFRGEVWTCERVARVIRKEFGVSYHPAHVSRLLKALRQSLQKPQRRANQRDEEAIEHWKEHRWPSLKKGRKGSLVVGGDLPSLQLGHLLGERCLLDFPRFSKLLLDALALAYLLL
jgi:transposase